MENSMSPSNIDSTPPPKYDFIDPIVPTLENQSCPSDRICGQLPVPVQTAHVQPIDVLHNVFTVTDQTANINDYMLWSIINLCFGGIIFGFVGILLSIQVRNRKRNGDIDGAIRLSKTTAKWNTVITFAGIGLAIAAIIYVITIYY
ncbi:unnamed protein product [Rotaria sp. Silwood2]|nr:unnamed protein product [Rotaria sp. Silwood2]CAF4009961.1 unnamed protein product [Rotaria sp. Silwood2]